MRRNRFADNQVGCRHERRHDRRQGQLFRNHEAEQQADRAQRFSCENRTHIKNWYTEKTGGKLYTTVTAITTSQTFYAQFTANTYTVTWNLGDGRSETPEQTYGEKLVLPTDPERKNA